jgi:hypothetical protein
MNRCGLAFRGIYGEAERLAVFRLRTRFCFSESLQERKYYLD